MYNFDHVPRGEFAVDDGYVPDENNGFMSIRTLEEMKLPISHDQTFDRDYEDENYDEDDFDDEDDYDYLDDEFDDDLDEDDE